MASPVFKPKVFGERVKMAVERANLSYRQAALLMGVNYQALWRVCQGRMPTVPTYLRIVAWDKTTTEDSHDGRSR